MLQRHVAKTCVVHIEATCSRDAKWVKVAGTKPQHVLAHENVARTYSRDMWQWHVPSWELILCNSNLGDICLCDVSHEVQRVECCAACGVDKIFPKLLLHNISLHKERSHCNICLGHVPATFSCVQMLWFCPRYKCLLYAHLKGDSSMFWLWHLLPTLLFNAAELAGWASLMMNFTSEMPHQLKLRFVVLILC